MSSEFDYGHSKWNRTNRGGKSVGRFSVNLVGKSCPNNYVIPFDMVTNALSVIGTKKKAFEKF